MTGRHQIIMLWAVPRSVSTAFERMMIERGDHTVFDEPYSAAYYRGPDRRSDRFATTMPGATWDAVTTEIETAAEAGPVFVKDMAYHAAPALSEAFLGRFTNSFLIRDPARVVPSMARKWPDLTEEEVGFTSLIRAYELLEGGAGPPAAPVMDADDLLADPAATIAAWCRTVGIDFDPGALTWGPGMRPEWKLWPDWYEGVAASTGFGPPPGDAPAPPVDERLAGLVQESRPAYDRMRAASRRP